MDLGAYANIDDLRELAKQNGIVMPRLRGYRLMENETPLDIDEIYHRNSCYIAEDAMCWDGWGYEMSDRTYRLCRKYLGYDYYIYDDGTKSKEKDRPVLIKWDKLHGKLRRRIKFELKQFKKKLIAECNMWNKYIGQDDILYVHSRCGGYNWSVYQNEIENLPGYLESTDASFDSTYRDSYFKIKR